VTDRGRLAANALAVSFLLAAVVLASLRHASREPLDVRETAGEPGRYEARFTAMSTDVRLSMNAPSLGRARSMAAAALARVREVERLMSAYAPDSDVSRLNRLGGRGDVALSAQTMHVLQRAGEVHGLTHGAFDVTYAPLRDLWRDARQSGRPPDSAAVREALARVGFERLILGADGARFGAVGMEVDLGGIAKGYAIDLAAESLRRGGATHGFADIGGDLRFFGLPPGRSRWRVEVYRPPGLTERPLLSLHPCAVTTSGDYARGFRVGDEWYSHIIDPRTGRPVGDVPSVTVVAPDATTADALATGLAVLGPEDGLALVDSLAGVECMMLVRDAGGRISKHLSGGFHRFLESQ